MKKLAMLSLACMLAFPMTVHAEDADRIAALEEAVAALEQRVAALEGGAAPAGVSATPAQEAVTPAAVETGIEYNGCSAEFVDHEVSVSYDDGSPCVILYFDYFNGSGETKHFSNSFSIQVFQHGKEMKWTIGKDNQECLESSTDLRSGADPLRVASAYKIEDQSEIIVSIKGHGSGDAPLEFTVSLE